MTFEEWRDKYKETEQYLDDLLYEWATERAAFEAAIDSEIEESFDFVKRDPKSILEEDEIYAIWGAGAGMEGAMQDAYSAGFNAAKIRWIPVTERLPEKENTYPILIDNVWSGDCATYVKVKDGEYFEIDPSDVPIWIDRLEYEKKITHWMELPE